MTPRVPNFRVIRSESMLEMMVHPDIIIEMIPMNEIGTPRSAYMTGQPAPSSESGRPRLINAR